MSHISEWSVFAYNCNQLVIYDGFSQYLTKIGMAADLDYYAEWKRVHK